MKNYCAQCLKPFETAYASQEFCAPGCRKVFHQEVIADREKTARAWANIPSRGNGQIPDLGLSDGSDREDDR